MRKCISSIVTGVLARGVGSLVLGSICFIVYWISGLVNMPGDYLWVRK